MARFTRAEIRRIIGEACTDEIENSIIALHIGVVDPLKDELQTAKADAAKLETVQKELDDLKKSTADYEELKTKYEDEHKAFEDFKKNVDETNSLNKVKDAYKALLKAQNVDDKRIEAILKVTDFADKKLGKDGKFEDEGKLVESIKDDWKDFIVTKENRGALVETPPANGGKVRTKEEIMKIKDTEERQKAIAENP
jgi:hypothetical protein